MGSRRYRGSPWGQAGRLGNNALRNPATVATVATVTMETTCGAGARLVPPLGTWTAAGPHSKHSFGAHDHPLPGVSSFQGGN